MVNRALRIAYLFPDGRTVSFRRDHFKHVDALEIDQIDASAIKSRRQAPRQGRVDDGRRQMWAKFDIDDKSEWIWGSQKNKWEKIACVINTEMLQPNR